MSLPTNLRPTLWMRRELPGAAALLAGGVGFVGLILVHVAMGASPSALGMAVSAVAPLSNVELHDLGGEEAVALPVLPLSTSGRTAVRGLSLANEAPLAEPRLKQAELRSQSQWFEAYKEECAGKLQIEARTVLVEGQIQSQAIGLLLALESKGQDVSREAFLQAVALPETTARGLSIPAFVVMRLAKSASDRGARRTLEQIAFSTNEGVSVRLRGQAIAALVAHTPQTEERRLRDRLACISDPRLLASARGAAIPAP